MCVQINVTLNCKTDILFNILSLKNWQINGIWHAMKLIIVQWNVPIFDTSNILALGIVYFE